MLIIHHDVYRGVAHYATAIMAFIMAIVIAHHGVIFRMKYMKSKAFEQQQFAALDRMSPFSLLNRLSYPSQTASDNL